MAGGVSGGVSGTKADIGVGGGGGEGSPSGEGLGSAGILAIIAAGAPGPGSARGPFSMVVASMEVLGGLSDGGGGGPRPGRGSRGASRPARLAGNDLEAAALGMGEVEAGGQRSYELPATRCQSSATAILLLCPAPAQSWSRPNPIVQPGLGLASPHVPSARGTATPAVMEFGATAGRTRGPRPRPAVQHK